MAEQKENQASFRVIYYAFTGRAEPIRLAAALGGLAFEDEFISQAQQKKTKSEGGRRWSGPPEVVVYDKDGKVLTNIAQSNTCLRYVGKIAGIYPDDAVQRALMDEVVDSVEDLFAAALPAFFRAKDEEDKKTKCAEVCKEGGVLRYWLDKFLARIEENEKRGNKNGLFVGDELSIADLKFCGVATYIYGMMPGGKAVLDEDKYKPLLKIFESVKSNDKIKAFNEQLKKNIGAYKEKPENNVFKYNGKSVPGCF